MDTANTEEKELEMEEIVTAPEPEQIASPVRKSAEYQDLIDSIKQLRRSMAETENRQIQLKYSGRINQVQLRIEAFEKAVQEVADAFSKVIANTQRVQMAKSFFVDGLFREARNILEVGKMPAEVEASVIKDEKKDTDSEENLWTLQKKGTEFFLLAHLMALDYEAPEYMERTKEYFDLSISANPSLVNVLTYAKFLKHHLDFEKAIPLFGKMLARLQKQAEDAEEPHGDLVDIASTFNHLGEMYAAQEDFAEAKKHFESALKIQRGLMVLNQEAQLIQMELVLHNLGDLFKSIGEHNQADSYYNQALKTQRKLAEISPEEQLPRLADLLNKMAKIHRERLRHDLAVTFYEQSLEIRREFVKDNPELHLPGLAETLNKLGNLQRDRNSYDIAEMFYEEAFEIKRELVALNPHKFTPELGTLLNNLGILYRDDKKPDIAKAYFDEAMELYVMLVKIDAKKHLPASGMTLNNMGILYRDKKNYEFAARHFEEALKIYENLAEEDPGNHLAYLGTVLNNFGSLFMDQKRYERAEKYYKEAFFARKKLSELRPNYFSPELGMTFLNLSTFYQVCKPNQNLSLMFVDAAITSLIPFCKIPYIKNYFAYAAKVLRTWGLDAGKYVKQRGFSEPAIVKKSLKEKVVIDNTVS